MAENKRPYYSLEDIRSYLLGRLSESQMHAIEKAAMEDPFLADAIEGVETALLKENTRDFSADIAELNFRLQETSARKNRETAPILKNFWWKAAVAAGIVATGMIISLRIADSRPSTMLSKNGDRLRQVEQKRTSKADTSAATAIMETQEPNMPNMKRPFAPGLQARTDTDTAARRQGNALDLTTEAVKGSPIRTDTDSFADQHLNDGAVASTESRIIELLSGKAQGVIAGKNSGKWKVINGKVIGADGRPVRATVSADASPKKWVLSDSNGNFSIQISEYDSLATLSVSAIGYEPSSETVDIKNRDMVIMRMIPSDASFEEVVVTGYGVKSKSAEEKAANSTKAVNESRRRFEPQGGWRTFDQYVLSSKKNPVGAGEEIMAFAVDSLGRPMNFEIIKSISPAHHAEVIRLLQNGPSWKLIKGKKRKITISIAF